MVHARCISLAVLSYSACGRAFVLGPRIASAAHVINRPHHGFVGGLHQRSRRVAGTAAAARARVVLASAATEGDGSLEGVVHSAQDALEPLGEANAAKPWDGVAATAAVATVALAAGGLLLQPELAGAADSFAGGLQMPVAMAQLLADPVGSLAANPEWTRYAFMFPVGILVATCAQTAGIGGAAIMGPFFLLGLPLLGPAYPLHSVAASVATAILSEAFGFSSGLFGYFRRGLIDSASAVPFILASLPACLLGAIIVPYADERVLKALYAVFMLGLSAYLLFDEAGSESLEPEECSVEELESGEMKAICTSEGKEYLYRKPEFGTDSGLSTAFGGLMTGMLGVGIGEVVIPQLVKKNGVPLPVAAGTSVLVVFLNAVVAAGTQVGGIISRGGDEVPWNLIAFIVPGVVIGGQLAPRMQGRLSQRTMEKILAGVFGAVGATFATISFESLLAITTASASVP